MKSNSTDFLRGAPCRRGMLGLGPALVLVLASGAQRAHAQEPSQEPSQEAVFDALVAKAHALQTEGGARDEVRQAYQRALAAFLRLDPTASAYRQRVVAGARCALQSGRVDLAGELVADARRTIGDGDVQLLALELDLHAARGEVDALLRRAAAIAQSGRPEVATAALLRHERLVGPAADSMLRRGEVDAGLWAFEALSRAPASAGAQSIRLANLGLAQRNLGRLQAAEASYRRAVELAPDDAQTRADYGIFLRAVGRWEEAVAVFYTSYRSDLVPGQGPAITGLVQMEVLRPGSVRPDPLASAAAALEIRPEAAMLRRVALDLMLDRGGAPSPGADSAGR